MRRSQCLPRPLWLHCRASICLPLFVLLAVGWASQPSRAYAQPDPFHESIIIGLKKLASGRLYLPGLEPFPEGLNARLMRAYQAKGPDYKPRTHHLHSSGAPLYVNRLIFEASPYLLQHAHNPVNWYSWGPEAFAAAQAEGKVILVSIGYSTCYWCHVMEQDSYEDEALAEVLNRHFISIKVDREERPDVDKIHMDAVVAMRGQGGWPLNVFLTPDLKPFWGGTYFPRAQFLHILRQISTAWRKDPSKIERSGLKLTRFLKAQNQLAKGSVVLDEEVLRAAYGNFASSFDKKFGGFGKAPKFPPSMRLQMLLRMARRAGEKGSAHLREVPTPDFGSGEVLVRVIQVGLDGTDTEINEGLYGEATPGDNYFIIGHESLGVVEEVSSGVSDINVGDLVVATVRRPGGCLNCQAGENDMCLDGNYTEWDIKGAHGFLTDYYVEVPDYLVTLPAEYEPVGVLLEPITVAEKGIVQALEIQRRMAGSLGAPSCSGQGPSAYWPPPCSGIRAWRPTLWHARRPTPPA